MKWTFYKQHDAMDCGPTCLRMIAKFYGKNYSLKTLRALTEVNRSGTSMLGISIAGEKLGLKCTGMIGSIKSLQGLQQPCILHWRQNHFVVLIHKKKKKFIVADPARGIIEYTFEELRENWIGEAENGKGIYLSISPTELFDQNEGEKVSDGNWSLILRQLKIYKKLIAQLLCGLISSSLLLLIAPFLTQAIVDVGINSRSYNIMVLILLAQGTLIISRLVIETLRSWILLHISTRINISILTAFLIKLMKLPVSFFDTKQTSDIMQRMADQRSIESFLTGPGLIAIFSLSNLIVFSVILVYYNFLIFVVFFLSTVAYIFWIMLFLNARRQLNQKSFEISTKNQGAIIELVSGMQEIRLNNCEQQKRWEWENIQASLFNYSIRLLKIGQLQHGGATLINEFKNLVITYLSVRAVMNGDLTLGAMMATQYIIGQLNMPLVQVVSFIQGYQDANLSLERLNEIQEMENEETVENDLRHALPESKTIVINEITFSYPGTGNFPVLKNLSMTIPEGKTTAIVGMSGSGKTSLIKLLLRFYESQSGDIFVGMHNIKEFSFASWREKCGVVMQDGFIFSDTIEGNIAVGGKSIDTAQLLHAIKVANLEDFISDLPLGLLTKIGADGNGLSQGQKQRILIARAVYKEPQYLFFDEATNALDATNELTIMTNLQEFFNGKTVVIVAHRLSTVSNADNIVVLKNGEIIEQGKHTELIASGKVYYQLVKNQLELGL